MDVEVRHLRVLLKVADSGSVTSAAAQLGVSQPALSAQLGRIEQAIGGALFARAHDGVHLTPVGELVIDRARELVRDLEGLLIDVQRQCNDSAVLRVATNSPRYFSTFLVELTRLGVTRDVVPRINASSTVITEHLLRREVDVAVTGVHVGFNDECPPGLRQLIVVEHEPFLMAIASTHAAAGLREVPIEALADDEWLLPPGKPDGTHAALMATFRAAGIAPSSPLGRQELGDFWPYVAAGRAVSMALPTTMPFDGAVLRPIAGQPVVGTRVLRWNPERVNDDEAVACARAALVTYTKQLDETAAVQPWWHESPEHRPVVNSYLGAIRA